MRKKSGNWRAALCVACGLGWLGSAAADVVVETAAFRLTLGDDAVAKSLVVKATGEECLDASERLPLFASTQKRPFNNEIRLVQQAKRTTYPANRVRREGSRLRVGFETAPYEVVVRVDETPAGYATFRVEELVSNTTDEHQYYRWNMDVPPVDVFRLLQLPMKNRRNFGDWLNVMWDERACAGALAGCSCVDVVHEKHRAYHTLSVDIAHDQGVTNGVAVLAAAATPEAFLAQVDAAEAALGMPRGVASRRDTRLNASIYWTMQLTPETVDETIAFAKKGGFRMLLIYYSALVKGGRGGYRTLPDYTWRDAWSAEKFTAAVRKFNAAGITVGFHTLQTFIGFDSPYVTPEADHRLALVKHYTLARALPAAEGTCEVFVEENPVAAPMHPKCRILRFGTELFEYAGYTTRRPYKFTGVKRRHLGTYAKAHPRGEIGGVLGVSECGAVSAYIDQNSSLQDEVAQMIAKVYDCGCEFLYFDGSEDANEPCSINTTLAQLRVAQACRRAPLFTEGSAKSPYGWHLQSGANAFDIFPPEIFKEKIVEYPCKAAARFAKDFTRVDFGWWKFGLPKESGTVQTQGWWRADARTIGTQLDIWEYGTSKAAAWNSPATLQMTLPELRKHPRTDDILEMMRRWEDVRARRALTPAQKALLKDPAREFHLHPSGKGGYDLVAWKQLAVAGGRWTDVRAFVFTYGGRRTVAYWHARGRGTLVLADGTRLAADNLRHWTTDRTEAEIADLFNRARIERP